MAPSDEHEAKSTNDSGKDYNALAMHKDEPTGRMHIHPFVFWVSAALIFLFVLGAAVLGATAEQGMAAIKDWMTVNFGWLYVISMAIFLVLAIWIGMSRFGSLRLGAQDEEPEFSLSAWLAMLFSAGMGIGLLFWSVAEPIYHYESPPDRIGVQIESIRMNEQNMLEVRRPHELEAANAVLADAEAAYAAEQTPELQQQLETARQTAADAEEAATPEAITRDADVVAKQASSRSAMRLTFYHWGLHPWGVYALVGLGLAYFGYRHDLPLTIRSIFWPILGEKIHGRMGDIVDTLAVVSTMFGVATSLGLGVMQINAGLGYVSGEISWLPTLPDNSLTAQIVLIALITACATISVVTGVKRGIKILSQSNMVLAFLLVLFLFLTGPIVYLLDALVENIGNYLQQLPQMTFGTDAYGDGNWLGAWTVFYWAWWIAWSPFVGMFIARVSRGRTVREFIIGVLLVPAFMTFVWLTIFGNSALFLEMAGYPIADAVHQDLSTALFVVLENYPLATLVSLAATVCIVLFFVTSSDSASMVIDIITAGGHPDPPIPQRVFWAVTEGVVAAVLLLAGGLNALQTASILTGLPFCIVILIMCYSLVRGLHDDERIHHPDKVYLNEEYIEEELAQLEAAAEDAGTSDADAGDAAPKPDA